MLTEAPIRPLVTFGLLGYSQEKFIRQAVEGAFAQTYTPLEIVLSDDASQDGTFEIMREMARSYRGPHKVILNRNERNGGLGQHVNRIAGLSKGEWVVTAAGDDVSLPHRVQRLMEYALSAPGLTGGCSLWQRMDENSRDLAAEDTFFPAQTAPATAPRHSHIPRFVRAGYPGVSGCSAIWRRDLFEGFPPLPENLMIEDLPLTVRALLLGDIFFLPDKLVRYRIHPENISQARETASAWQGEEKTARFYSRLSDAYNVCARDLAHYKANHHPPLNGDLAADIDTALAERNYSCSVQSAWWKMGYAKRLHIVTRKWFGAPIHVSTRWMVNRLLPRRIFSVLKERKRPGGK